MLLSVATAPRTGQAGFPVGWDSTHVCDPDGIDVCYIPTAHTDRWQCDVDRIDPDAVEYFVYMIYGDPAGDDLCDGEDYCAFGYALDSSSTETARFICPQDGSGLDEAWLVGTAENDDFNMSSEGGIDTGKMFGNGDPDDLHGSKYAVSGYTDKICGGGGHDTIWLHAGDDQLSGNDGNDTIWGGDGNDNICGHGDCDDLRGEDGDDDQVHVGTTIATGDSSNGGPGSSDDCYPVVSYDGCEAALSRTAEPTCPVETGFSTE